MITWIPAAVKMYPCLPCCYLVHVEDEDDVTAVAAVAAADHSLFTLAFNAIATYAPIGELKPPIGFSSTNHAV